jgi:hypothetical protein
MKHDHKQANKKQRNMKTTWAYESIKRKQMEKQRNEERLKRKKIKHENYMSLWVNQEEANGETKKWEIPKRRAKKTPK